MNGRARIARSGLSALRSRVSQDATQFRSLDVRLLDNRTKTTEDKTEPEASGGHVVAALLVAALSVLFSVLGHADHLGDADGVETSEGLLEGVSVHVNKMIGQIHWQIIRCDV